MALYESMFLNLLFILFPLLLYLFYIAYNRNLGKEENNLFLDVALLTSFYLTLRYGYTPILLMINIPLLVSYVKKRYLVMFISSILLVIYYKNLAGNVLLFSLEYLLYFLLFLFFEYKKWKKEFYIVFFLILKVSLSFPFIEVSVLEHLLSCLSFLISTYLVFFFFQKGEEILKFHRNVKELEQEKQIRTSLFKITHEIKNPIAVCKGYLDMFDVNNVSHSKKYIPILKEEINRTLILLQDFLSMTKIKIEKDILDINFLLEEVLKQFEPMLKERKIACEVNLEEEEIDILGDYNRLTQVFINLIKNSVEAFEKKENCKIKISTKKQKKEVQIIMEDNGCGIPSAIIEKIKDPFYTTKKNGTGLGVSLSYEIIKSHGGTIQYESKEGVGTKITLFLPLFVE